MGFSAEVDVQGFGAEVRMVKQRVWGLAPNRVGFSAESLFLLCSLALAVESAQIEILGFSAESQMVEQSGGL